MRTVLLCAFMAAAGVWSCAAASAAAPRGAEVAVWGGGIEEEQGWVSVTSMAASDLDWATPSSEERLAEVLSVTHGESTPAATKFSNDASHEAAELGAADSAELQGLLQRVAWVTGVLGVLALLALWFFRAWLTRPQLTGRTGRALQIVESLRIGSRCGVFLVQAEQHRVLISIDQGRGMQMLTLPASFAETLQAIPEEREDAEPVVTRSDSASDLFGGLASRRIWRAGAST